MRVCLPSIPAVYLIALVTACPLAAIPADPALRFVGNARNGAYSGRATLDLATDGLSGRTSATLAFSDGLAGNATLEGSIVRDRLRLDGILVYGTSSYTIRVDATFEGKEVLTGSYRVLSSAGGEPQDGTLSLAAVHDAPQDSSSSAPESHSSQLLMNSEPGSTATLSTGGDFRCGIYLNGIWSPSWSLTLGNDGNYRTSRGESGAWQRGTDGQTHFKSGNLQNWIGFQADGGALRFIQKKDLAEDETTQLWLSQYCNPAQ